MKAKTYIYIAVGTVALTTIGYFAWKKWFKKPIVESEDNSGGGGGSTEKTMKTTPGNKQNTTVINKRPQVPKSQTPIQTTKPLVKVPVTPKPIPKQPIVAKKNNIISKTQTT